MAFKKWTVTEPYLDTKCGLGEGPFYNESKNELRFVDIVGEKLHILDLAQGPDSMRTISTGLSIGVTADIEGSETTILAGAKDGVTKFNINSATHEYIAKYWNEDDGPDKAKQYVGKDQDCHLFYVEGRFWVGTMNDPLVKEPTEAGVLFRLDTDGSLHRIMEKGPVIPNGISWNDRNDTMFLTDSPENNILAFDFDATTGNISNKRVFFHHQENSFLDGHVRDAEGCFWHACYGGSKVIRISPAGVIIGEISLPTRNITCPVFVGTELYVTSAAEEEPDKYPESAQFAGNLFRLDVGVEGLARHRVRLSKQV